MNSDRIPRLSVAGLLLAALAVSAVAPVAEANQGSWRRYKSDPREVRVVRHDYAPRREVEYRSSSSAGPALAGFIGGLALAAILNHSSQSYEYAQAPPPEPDYYYYDPYSHERYASLEIYYSNTRHCDHPRIVRMIDARSGECVRTYCRDHGRWAEWNDEDEGDGD